METLPEAEIGVSCRHGRRKVERLDGDGQVTKEVVYEHGPRNLSLGR